MALHRTRHDRLELASHEIRWSVQPVVGGGRERLSQSFDGLYSWELIYRQGPWRGLDNVEFAMTYVDWFNHQ